MGGAVSGVAGPNWMLIGDAAAGVNPLNGEGIDYGLEMGRFAAEMLGSGDFSQAWPTLLQEHYARAFSVARRLAWLLTVPWLLPTVGPFAMRSVAFMQTVVRVMGNLVVDEDVDRVARLWRRLGAGSRFDRPPAAVQLRLPTGAHSRWPAGSTSCATLVRWSRSESVNCASTQVAGSPRRKRAQPFSSLTEGGRSPGLSRSPLPNTRAKR